MKTTRPFLLSAATFALVLAMAMPAMATSAADPSDAVRPPLERPQGQDRGESRGAERLKKVDTDGDGLISKSEFLAQAEERFAKIDTNSDGKISPEEMKAHHQAMMQEHRANRGQRGQGQHRGGDAMNRGAPSADASVDAPVE